VRQFLNVSVAHRVGAEVSCCFFVKRHVSGPLAGQLTQESQAGACTRQGRNGGAEGDRTLDLRIVNAIGIIRITDLGARNRIRTAPKRRGPRTKVAHRESAAVRLLSSQRRSAVVDNNHRRYIVTLPPLLPITTSRSRRERVATAGRSRRGASSADIRGRPSADAAAAQSTRRGIHNVDSLIHFTVQRKVGGRSADLQQPPSAPSQVVDCAIGTAGSQAIGLADSKAGHRRIGHKRSLLFPRRRIPDAHAAIGAGRGEAALGQQRERPDAIRVALEHARRAVGEVSDAHAATEAGRGEAALGQHRQRRDRTRVALEHDRCGALAGVKHTYVAVTRHAAIGQHHNGARSLEHGLLPRRPAQAPVAGNRISSGTPPWKASARRTTPADPARCRSLPSDPAPA
jgi:hypothetical protein